MGVVLLSTETAAAADLAIGERLVASGRLSREQLRALLAEQAARGGVAHVRLGTMLVEKGIVTAAQITASATHLPSVPSSASLPAEVRAALANPKRRLGNYVVLEELGRGAMGVVFRAHDLAMNRPVAIKILLGAVSGVRYKRFQVEAEAAAKLRHPAIVAAHDFGHHEGRPYIVMEYVEGQNLEMLFQSRLPQKWIAQLGRGVALALHEAHRNGIVHRDVKPENVIVDREGQPHLTDWGLARDFTKEEQRLTREGQALGTPSYMAPELTGEGPDQGPAVDIYSLGAILYRALVGSPPFEATSMAGLVKKLLFEKPVPPHQVRPDVDLELEAITLQCLEKDPAKRFASAGDLALALERYMKLGESAVEPIPEEVSRPRPPTNADDIDLEAPRPPRETPKEEAPGEEAPEEEASTPSKRLRRRRAETEEEAAIEHEKEVLRRVLKVMIPLGLVALVGLAVALNWRSAPHDKRAPVEENEGH